jgi:hypothetical protein
MKRSQCFTDRRPRLADRSIETATVRAVLDRMVCFAPLFDAYTMFKVKQRVQLRFRAREALSGIPIRSRDISFTLRHGANGAARKLQMKAVKRGVFEVPFSPRGPGQYWVTVSIRGTTADSVPAVRLWVAGLARDPSRYLRGVPRA